MKTHFLVMANLFRGDNSAKLKFEDIEFRPINWDNYKPKGYWRKQPDNKIQWHIRKWNE